MVHVNVSVSVNLNYKYGYCCLRLRARTSHLHSHLLTLAGVGYARVWPTAYVVEGHNHHQHGRAPRITLPSHRRHSNGLGAG